MPHKLGKYLLLLLFLLFAALNKFAEISFLAQFKFSLFILLNILTGSFLILKFRKLFNDDLFFIIIALLTGLAFTFFLSFVCYHRILMDSLQVKSIAKISILVDAFLITFAALGYYRLKCSDRLNLATDKKSSFTLLAIFTLSLLIWSASYLGLQVVPDTVNKQQFSEIVANQDFATRKVFYQLYNYDKEQDIYHLKSNRTYKFAGHTNYYSASLGNILNKEKSANWGFSIDKSIHLGITLYETISYKLPPQRKNHLGAEILVIASGSFLNLASDDDIYKASVHAGKMLAFYFYFIFIFLFYFCCHKLLEIKPKHAKFTIPAAVLLSPLVLPLSFDTTWIDFYSLVRFADSFSYNITNLFANVYGFACVTLIFIREKNKSLSLLPACFLCIVSFFIKPSAFVVLAPAIYLLIFLEILDSRKLNNQQFLALGSLLCVPIYFVLYDQFFTYLVNKPMTIGWSPFKLWTHKYFSHKVAGSELLTIIYKFSLFYAAFLPLLFYSCKNIRLASFNIKSLIASDRIALFSCFSLLFAFIVGTCLYENSHAILHVNFAWVLGSGFIFSLPFLLKQIFLLPGKISQISIILLILHISFGIMFLLKEFVLFNY